MYFKKYNKNVNYKMERNSDEPLFMSRKWTTLLTTLSRDNFTLNYSPAISNLNLR